MKYIFSTKLDERRRNFSLLFLRLAAGAFMLTHGLPKLQKLTSGAEIKFADPFGLGPEFSLVLAVIAEVLCSILIMLGLGTRVAALFLITTMSVAAFHAHAADPFSTKEKALLFLVIFIFLFLTGAGRFSIDQFIVNRR